MAALRPGVGVALVSLMRTDGSVDVAATADHASYLVTRGITSVLVAGTTGEAALLTVDERVSLLRAVRDALPADVPVIAGTGAPIAFEAVSLTAAAVDAGADVVLAMSPPSADVAVVRRYFDDVAAACGPVPLLAYHFPRVWPPGIPLDVLRGLPVAGTKDSSADPERLLVEVTTWDRPVYVGAAMLLVQAGAVGAAGAILAIANVEPELCAAAFAGDAQAQRALVPAHLVARTEGPAGVKRLAADRYGTSAAARG